MVNVWILAVCVAFVAVTSNNHLAYSQQDGFDVNKVENDIDISFAKQHKHAHHHHRKPLPGENLEKDETQDEKVENPMKAVGEQSHHGHKKHKVENPSDSDLDVDVPPPPHSMNSTKKSEVRGRGAKNRKLQKEKQAEQERGWHYCSDGRSPKEVKDLEMHEDNMGHMCREMYPVSTCCYDHDLTMELVGDKILEQIPEMQCARMLMKLRCAHCSPRSWWLFHAPDKVRYPHKRVLPIMCRSFCRKFHRLCRDSVAGLEGDSFCDYHTTSEDGPCFPDSLVKRGTID